MLLGVGKTNEVNRYVSGMLSFNHHVPVLLLGVGKTSVVIRYVGGMFSKAVSPTIGASFFTYKM